MTFEDDDDLDLDSLFGTEGEAPEPEPEAAPLAQEPTEGEPPAADPDRGGGDVRVALRQEREEKKFLASRIQQLEADNQRSQALLAQFSRQQQPQAPPPQPTDAQRQAVLEQFEQNPIAVLDYHARQAAQAAATQAYEQARNDFGVPALLSAGLQAVQAQPGGAELVAHPKVREILDAQLRQGVQAGQIRTVEDIQATAASLVQGIQMLRSFDLGAPASAAPGAQPAAPQSAYQQAAALRQGARSAVGGSTAGPAKQAVNFKNMSSAEIKAWEQSPEGKASLEASLREFYSL